MNKEDIIRMAREAGFVVDGDTWIHAGSVLIDGRKSIDKHLRRFAALVAAAEREACATFLEHGVDLGGLAEHSGWQKYTADLLTGCAAAIRARSNP